MNRNPQYAFNYSYLDAKKVSKRLLLRPALTGIGWLSRRSSVLYGRPDWRRGCLGLGEILLADAVENVLADDLFNNLIRHDGKHFPKVGLNLIPNKREDILRRHVDALV